MEYKLTLPPSSSNMEETVSMTTIRWNKNCIVKDASLNTKLHQLSGPRFVVEDVDVEEVTKYQTTPALKNPRQF